MSASWCNVSYYLRIHGLKRHQLACCKKRLDGSDARRQFHQECRRLLQKQVKYVETTYDVPTVPGERKDTGVPLPAQYSPRFVEAAWYDWWVKEGFFSPDYKTASQDPGGAGGGSRTDREKFVICLPPPNVTGTLHLGHALTNSIQDALVRWNRMKGKEVLWLPGCDHAGIATQVVVEKRLWKDRKVTRHDLGREKFIEEVWKWKEEKGDTIYRQMQRLGSSLDWHRAVFTMDEARSRAVIEAFVRLHDDGLIYRANRLVHWSCQLKSAISDIEVENQDIPGGCLLQVPGYSHKIPFGRLTSFAYPVLDSGEELVVSTTRPETMLGDTAVAVHPADPRYTALHGKFVIHPIDQRHLPIICDEFVDREFGTGAVKITPAHDHNDFKMGTRHGLPFITVIDDTGAMENVPSIFKGMKRFDARSKVIEVLSEKKLYRGETDHQMVLPVCSRSKDVIEPRLKEQWYVDCQEMARHAVQAVQSGQLNFMPEYLFSMWFDWLNDCEDWCVSRQLWWGHRIPAYEASLKSQTSKGQNGGRVWVSGRNEQEAYSKAAQQLGVAQDDIKDDINLEQDEDVLDTWFSSALFPFSSLGWPDQTTDLARFYPNSLLETGYDIINFWVARMVMLGYRLTGQLPFTEVLFHGTLRDAHNRKMSKSLGNVIDPMDVINGISLEGLHGQVEASLVDRGEVQRAKAAQKQDFPGGIPEYGTDALRFTLCSTYFKDQHITMDVQMVQSNRVFCNKIWQSFRFVSSKFPAEFRPSPVFTFEGSSSPIDAWILSRLSYMVKSCDQNFLSYDLQLVTKTLNLFWVQDFCDIYLESVKPVFLSGDSSRQQTVLEILHLCVDTFLRCVSPFMPYLAEELFQRLPVRGDNRVESVCIAPYPQPDQYPWRDLSLESEFSLVQSISTSVLSVCAQLNLPKKAVNAYIKVSEEQLRDVVSQYQLELDVRCRLKSVSIVGDDVSLATSGVIHKTVEQGVAVCIPIQGLIDATEELAKLKQRRETLLTSLEKLKNKPSRNEQAVNKKLQDSTQKLQHLEEAIGVIEQLS